MNEFENEKIKISSSDWYIKIKVKYVWFQIHVETVRSSCNKVSGLQLPVGQCSYVLSTLSSSSQ